MSQNGHKGELQADIPKQQQSLPGSEREMQPTSESTKLEGKDGLHEYLAAGKLRNKKALITGGDSGIGRAVAILMAREGADVTIVYLPEEQEDANDTKKAVEKEGQSCHLVAVDLRDYSSCKKAVDEHINTYKKLDIVVNNASKQIMCPKFEDINLDDVDSIFRSNILQMIAVTKYALPHLEKGASIINTTSVVAFRGTGSMVDYAATKGAIVGFTRSLAKQLVKRGIRVNAVAPGPVHTPLQPASRPAEQMEGFGSKTQLGRPFQPSEVAPTFIFLATADSELYYGQVLHPYPLGD